MTFSNIPLKWSRKHRTRLVKAAGVAKVDLVCTALTWRLLRTQARSQWSTVAFPGDAKEGTDDREMLRISLTGPQLTQLMERTLWGTLPMVAATPGERAVYQRAYDAVATVIDGVDLAIADGAEVPDIVIDARIAAD
ncbi:hypothetical protein [Streptomyces chartreusis]|uniref:hypothetical protein n=1 Tax=Streptomyces chartreusis TaxID=1969 RepID=UPI00123DCABE|nr:hypothetical protein [Streptomyces chartreusis]QEV68656.1 hypothetical protein CP983_19575 [Streptomyces chartreusis]GGX50049.1 hypothetical protein GCM10010321_78840 [Streptomyces chartreusis]